MGSRLYRSEGGGKDPLPELINMLLLSYSLKHTSVNSCFKNSTPLKGMPKLKEKASDMLNQIQYMQSIHDVQV